MTKDDIKVTLDKGMLTITGERKQEKMEKEVSFVVGGRGAFQVGDVCGG